MHAPALLALLSCRSTDPPRGHHPDETDGTTASHSGLAPGTTEPDWPDRLARLSHLEWENTVVDLLHLTEATHLSEHFVHDPTRGPFDNTAADLFVHPVLQQQYQAAAEELAERVLSDPGLRSAVLDPDPAADPEAWIRAFGERAHRRPLTDPQAAAYLALYREGPTIWASGDAAADGARLVLTAILQSPWFLYRVESPGEPDEDGVVRVDAWDLASRVSYGLWNTLPDDRLRGLARTGALLDDAELDTVVGEMLGDPRAAEVLDDLHAQLFRIDGYDNISPDVAMYPSFSETTPDAFHDEAELFLRDVAASGTVRDLVTSRRTWVNTELAELYGVGPVPDDGAMHPVDLDPSRRAGVLTLPGRLALASDPTTDRPVQRGYYVLDKLLCVDLPPPPPGVNPTIPPDDTVTTRERVEATTGVGTCGEACHATFLNPLGFAYGHYGALGEWRDDERGMPIDASGSFRFDDGMQSWTDAVELAGILAERPQVHACYAHHLANYLFRRTPTPEDEVLIERVARDSLEGDAPIRAMVSELMTAPELRTRAPSARHLPDDGR